MPLPVFASTVRATQPLWLSTVRPASTGTRLRLRFCPLFRVLAPSASGEGGKKPSKQEDKMKFEQAKQIVETAIQQLAESLERGHSEELRRYLTAMAKFRKYSLHNVLLILSQRPNASHVAGFHTWRALGRYVKKGAKGILIFAPIARRAQSTDPVEEETKVHRIAGFRGVYVFDQADTEGDALPQFSACHGEPSAHTEALKVFVLARGAELEYSDRILPALGQCSPRKI